MNLFTLAWKNLRFQALPSLLSLFLFTLGMALVIWLYLLNKQINEKLENNQAGVNMVIGAKGSPLTLVLSSLYQIDNPTGNVTIEQVKPFLNPKHPLLKKAIPLSMGDSYQGFRIVGTTHDYIELFKGKLQSGHLFQKPMQAVVGARVAASQDLKPGDTFFSSHGFVTDAALEHKETVFTVSGILEANGTVLDQLVITSPVSVWQVHGSHEATAESHDHDEHEHDHTENEQSSTLTPETSAGLTNTELLQYPDKQITSILVLFKHINAGSLNMIRGINENTDVMAANPAYQLDNLFSNIGIGVDALRWLAYIIVLVSGLSIFISLYATLRERRHELSMMRVMGSSPQKLFTLLLLEGFLISFAGCVLGFLLGHLGMEILGKYMQNYYPYAFTGWTGGWHEVWFGIGGLGVGVLASLLPAWQASKTQMNAILK